MIVSLLFVSISFQIDDCRRTHCYDQFICTFLSMLAEQGHLANLVEGQMKLKKRPTSGSSSSAAASKKAAADKRKRAKAKKKR